MSSLAGWFRLGISHEIATTLSVGDAVISEGTSGVVSASKLTQILGQVQLFNSCLTKGLDSMLATGWRLSSVPFWIDLSNMTVCLLKASQRESLLAKQGLQS